MIEGKLAWFHSVKVVDLTGCERLVWSTGEAVEHAVAPQPLAVIELWRARGGR
jgi:hypothetical protein